MSNFTQESYESYWGLGNSEIVKKQLSTKHLLFIIGILHKELQDEHDRLSRVTAHVKEDTARNKWLKNHLLFVLFGKRSC